MAQQMNKGLIKIKVAGWQSNISGVVIAENKDWIILHLNPVDFVLDGFSIIMQNYIEKTTQEKEELFKYSVIKSCDKVKSTRLQNFSGSAIEIVKNIGNLYETLAVRRELDDEMYVGNYECIKRRKLFLNSIKTNGRIDKKEGLDFDSIRAIDFETDYLTSLGSYVKLKN